MPDVPPPVAADDHVRGPADAAVTLLEYGDYECPDCAATHAIVTQLLAEHAESLRFVFRHFPLVSVHPRAAVAHQAAEAAAAQGKFWAFHDLLYASPGGPAIDDLDRLAIKLGLELYQFRRDVDAGRFATRVTRDADAAHAIGVSGTPTFFLNGERLAASGHASVDALRSAVEAGL
jgi:protein-disulfide isomerase